MAKLVAAVTTIACQNARAVAAIRHKQRQVLDPSDTFHEVFFIKYPLLSCCCVHVLTVVFVVVLHC